MKPSGVLLDDYTYMSDPTDDHANAQSVHDCLTGEKEPRMPPGGPFWTAEQIALFDEWMSDVTRPDHHDIGAPTARSAFSAPGRSPPGGGGGGGSAPSPSPSTIWGSGGGGGASRTAVPHSTRASNRVPPSPTIGCTVADTSSRPRVDPGQSGSSFLAQQASDGDAAYE